MAEGNRMMAKGKSKEPKAPKDWAEQANRLLGGRHFDPSSRHAAKQAAGLKGNASTGKIHSFSSLAKYTQVLKNTGEWMHKTYGVTRLDKITTEQAQAYLEHRKAAGIGQKQLDSDRLGLRYLKLVGDLERVKPIEERKLAARAYTKDQINRIAARQTPRNALATEIAHKAGLRAHELSTLKRADEGAPSPHREWRDDRFQGRSGERYLVTGKGGLIREVLIPHGLAQRLEARRLDGQAGKMDRQIRYQDVRYDIGAGQAWSQSISQTAKAELGRSTGAHGIRHSYAQERLPELQRIGHSYDDAKMIISQELGHFRPDVVNAYLR